MRRAPLRLHPDEDLFPFSMEETAGAPLILQCAGVSRWRAPRQNHVAPAKAYSLELIHQGHLRLESASGMRILGPGDLLILEVGGEYRYGAEGGGLLAKSWITLHGALVEYLLRIYGLEGKTSIPNLGALNPHFRRMIGICARAWREGTHARKLVHPLSLWLHEVICLASEEAALSQGSLSLPVSRMKLHLERNPERAIRLAELAAASGLSVSQSIRRFKAELGVTPYAWQLGVRLSRARSLLSKGGVSVREVARRCGFGDEHYFSTLFKEKTGRRPSAWGE